MDRADAAHVYEAHAPSLVRFATTLVGPADAADVVAEAFLVAFAGGGLEQAVDHRGYLQRCVLNRVRQDARSRARRVAREQAVLRSVVPAAAEPYGGPDVDVHAALGRLSPQQRAAIHLTYWDDLTPAAVAEVLGVTEGSVRRQLARARKRLKEVLDVVVAE